MRLLAQAPVQIGTFEGIGPLGKIGNSGSVVFGQFDNIVSTIVGVLTVSAGLWFIFQLLGGALQWLGSGGDKQAVQNAQKRIVSALTGLLIVVLSYALIAVISRIFGLYILSPFEALLGTTPPDFGAGDGLPDCVPGQPC
jgi:hypothetical protein